jgi:Uma2 family endonuclease
VSGTIVLMESISCVVTLLPLQRLTSAAGLAHLCHYRVARPPSPGAVVIRGLAGVPWKDVPEGETGPEVRPMMPLQETVATAHAPGTTGYAGVAGRDERIAFAASWEVYRALAEAIGDQHVLLAYDGERVELMSPGREHEVLKVLVERLVGALAAALRVPCKGFGSMRWERPEAARGLEGDATFYLTREKLAVARRQPADDAEYPAPDLAVEIDTSRPLVDRASIYQILGVPEVWRFDGESVRIDRLGPDGTYTAVDESGFLGVRTDEVTHLLLTVAPEAEDDNDFTRRVGAWARAVVVPRRTG